MAAKLASSRLKLVPLKHAHPVGPALAGKQLICSWSAVDLLLIFLHIKPKHRQSRLGCRLNAGLAEWAERHGCRESRPPPWMADGGGPTERDRSEGTLTKEGPTESTHPWLLGVLFQVTRRRRNSSAVRQNPKSPSNHLPRLTRAAKTQASGAVSYKEFANVSNLRTLR